MAGPWRRPCNSITPEAGRLKASKVPGGGLEPPRPYGQRILSPQRLPFRHPGINRKSHGAKGGFFPESTPTKQELRWTPAQAGRLDVVCKRSALLKRARMRFPSGYSGASLRRLKAGAPVRHAECKGERPASADDMRFASGYFGSPVRRLKAGAPKTSAMRASMNGRTGPLGVARQMETTRAKCPRGIQPRRYSRTTSLTSSMPCRPK